LGSSSLQHIPGSGVHSARVCLTRYVPPSGFGYPPDGLLHLGPRRPYFVPTALLGFCPSELSPTREVSQAFPPAMDPHAVSLAVAPSDESSGRTGKTRLPGFDPPGSPSLPPARLTLTAAGCSPGLPSFPGHSTERLVRAPTQTPLTRLAV
jgi:hypothetical protein